MPVDTSSGDLTADRRADYAEMLFRSGDHQAAADLMLQALELAPNWALGWFRAGEMYEVAGAMVEATRAWQTALKIDPADRAGASLKLSLAGAADAPSAPPSAFVEALFDQYAPTFDASLVEKLSYKVPELLATAIVRAMEQSGRMNFAVGLDLGCGTGLMGERLRPLIKRLEGYDISEAMLKAAAGKGVYDHLAKADLQVLDIPRENADIIVAADVFMYLGTLEGIVATVACGLREGGIFAFSVERHSGPDPFILLQSRRYAHSEAYVRRLIAEGGLRMLECTTATIRKDRGEPLEGLIVVAELA